MDKKYWFLCFLFVGSFKLDAQDLPVITDSIYSQVLQEERKILIILPPGYQPGADTNYDVLYILDGEWDLGKVSRIEQFAVTEKFMPANIIIGIPNTYTNGVNQRARDFTPTWQQDHPNSGKAANFLSFLKNELIPYLNRKYSVNESANTLLGSSLGGLFGMYVFLTDPGLFRSYILSDPSLWWDKEYLTRFAMEKWGASFTVGRSLYISGRTGKDYKGMGIAGMEALLRAKTPNAWHWQCMPYPDETHTSVILKTAYDGLKWTYVGYRTMSLNLKQVVKGP